MSVKRITQQEWNKLRSSAYKHNVEREGKLYFISHTDRIGCASGYCNVELMNKSEVKMIRMPIALLKIISETNETFTQL